MSEFLISIIMPTYNSEKTIEKSLQSIRRQTIDQSQVEILILDGGSKDATLAIAAKYNANILKNERKLPEFAKQQGLMAAKGKYGIFIDSDESFANMESLKRRIDFLHKHLLLMVSLASSTLIPSSLTNRDKTTTSMPHSFAASVFSKKPPTLPDSLVTSISAPISLN